MLQSSAGLGDVKNWVVLHEPLSGHGGIKGSKGEKETKGVPSEQAEKKSLIKVCSDNQMTVCTGMEISLGLETTVLPHGFGVSGLILSNFL